jgi:hypothetical protein
MSAPTVEAAVTPVLTAHDRCDQCGAQAYVRVALASGTLDFCGHHYGAHAPALTQLAVAIHDQRGDLQ